MRTSMVMLAFAVLGFTGCNAQEKKTDEHSNLGLSTKTKKEEPKGSWTVNKEFDENGNLKSYDSTYTYSYGSINGDTIANTEEMRQHFQRFFGDDEMSSAMMQRFFNDSTALGNDFFGSNLMESGFFQTENFPEEIQQEIKKMDSIHQQMLKNNYPQLFIKEDEQKLPSEKKTTQQHI
ncbi:hypothetical protein [Zunongwangia pacifica]|uniref:Uncharacterized protein n=1 Tax=Zunongwangia pacifica TaxID=2911062 RepID=A0A9X2CLR4_9FLAO|nr:hypothetical protein [Zunongwangia pacifica]MCL6216689.1 hypothetical protein [Zunongwangia pacifica]